MYKPGSIVLIKMHPASGQELKKFRPAIIIQSHSIHDFITFLPLISQTKKISSSETIITPTPLNGLEKKSLILCWYIQTVGTNRIQKQLGKLTQTEFKLIKTHLHNSLSL